MQNSRVALDLGAALSRAGLDAYVSGLRDVGWGGDRRLVELGMLASAVKYDWLTPAMLAAASSTTQLRYGGGEIDADYPFRERGLALLYNATGAERAFEFEAGIGR